MSKIVSVLTKIALPWKLTNSLNFCFLHLVLANNTIGSIPTEIGLLTNMEWFSTRKLNELITTRSDSFRRNTLPHIVSVHFDTKTAFLTLSSHSFVSRLESNCFDSKRDRLVDQSATALDW